MRLPVVGAEAFVLDPTKGIDGERPKELFPWHFNLGRTRVRDSKTERTAFSPTGKDDFHVPEKLAKLWGEVTCTPRRASLNAAHDHPPP